MQRIVKAIGVLFLVAGGSLTLSVLGVVFMGVNPDLVPSNTLVSPLAIGGTLLMASYVILKYECVFSYTPGYRYIATVVFLLACAMTGWRAFTNPAYRSDHRYYCEICGVGPTQTVDYVYAPSLEPDPGTVVISRQYCDKHRYTAPDRWWIRTGSSGDYAWRTSIVPRLKFLVETIVLGYWLWLLLSVGATNVLLRVVSVAYAVALLFFWPLFFSYSLFFSAMLPLTGVGLAFPLLLLLYFGNEPADCKVFVGSD